MSSVIHYLWSLIDVPWYVWLLDITVAIVLVGIWERLKGGKNHGNRRDSGS